MNPMVPFFFQKTTEIRNFDGHVLVKMKLIIPF